MCTHAHIHMARKIDKIQMGFLWEVSGDKKKLLSKDLEGGKKMMKKDG